MKKLFLFVIIMNMITSPFLMSQESGNTKKSITYRSKQFVKNHPVMSAAIIVSIAAGAFIGLDCAFHNSSITNQITNQCKEWYRQLFIINYKESLAHTIATKNLHPEEIVLLNKIQNLKPEEWYLLKWYHIGLQRGAEITKAEFDELFTIIEKNILQKLADLGLISITSNQNKIILDRLDTANSAIHRHLFWESSLGQNKLSLWFKNISDRALAIF